MSESGEKLAVKFRFRSVENHTQISIFTGTDRDHLIFNGNSIMDASQWKVIRRLLEQNKPDHIDLIFQEIENSPQEVGGGVKVIRRSPPQEEPCETAKEALRELHPGIDV